MTVHCLSSLQLSSLLIATTLSRILVLNDIVLSLLFSFRFPQLMHANHVLVILDCTKQSEVIHWSCFGEEAA